MENNNNHKLFQSNKKQIQASLKQTHQRSRSQVNSSRTQRPALRFSPTAWAKLLYFRDKTDNEVGGFGITEPDDLLFVTEFITVKQEVTSVSVKFDDQAVADFFDDQVDLGKKPEQFARIWLHSHPGDSPEPSVTDDETFARVFGNCDWSIMFIVARNGSTFARLRFNVGPGGEVKIPVCVDYSFEFEAADFELWKKQYKANVTADDIFMQADKSKQPAGNQQKNIEPFGNQNFSRIPLLSSDDLLSEIDQMDPMERQFFMDELAVRSDFWDEESEVLYE